MTNMDSFMFCGQDTRAEPSTTTNPNRMDNLHSEQRMQYPSDPAHKPLRGIPRKIAKLLATAVTEEEWHSVGVAFGKHLYRKWPKDRMIDDMHEPLAELQNYPPFTCDGRDRSQISDQIMALAWFHARAPDVFSDISWCELEPFLKGALEGYLHGGALVRKGNQIMLVP